MRQISRIGHSKKRGDTAVMVRVGFTCLALGVAVLPPRDADACGACYASNNESTVVSDHRMALAISKQTTILWDQIQYSGNPSNFAYVLPAKPGTRLEPSGDAWFAALDASTRPLIMPPASPPGSFGGSGSNRGGSGGSRSFAGDGESGGGCCSGYDDMSALASGPNASAKEGSDAQNAGSGAEPPPPPVQVVEQAVVGPYETVTLRSTDPEALQKWLTEHGYAIPEISGPIISQYVQNGFDFIALRLAPSKDKNERQIEPIRIVAPGADPTLPLRLMQIGGGAKVGITLYVIGEGRYHTQNFPESPVAIDKLIWDSAQGRSNYQELSAKAMEQGDGRTFITEYAKKPDFSPSGRPLPVPGSNMTGNPGLAAAYQQACGPAVPVRPRPAIIVPDVDAGVDGGGGDGGGMTSGDAGEVDAGTDAGDGQTKGDAGTDPVRVAICDDLSAAIDGMAQSDVWVTRMRGNLPNAALADTLILEPAPAQVAVDNVYQTNKNGNVTTASIAPRAVRWKHGTFALMAFTAFVLTRMLKRKKKQS